jgi:hypothetical protein
MARGFACVFALWLRARADLRALGKDRSSKRSVTAICIPLCRRPTPVPDRDLRSGKNARPPLQSRTLSPGLRSCEFR